MRTPFDADMVGSARGGACGSMRLGDPVIYQGRPYVLRGLDPMGISDRHADIEDVETGAVIRVPLSELSPG